jgi:class 3 adenylate cyclase
VIRFFGQAPDFFGRNTFWAVLGQGRGVAVNIGAQLVLKASTAEVLVSRTVKDLVAGSGFRFVERGLHSFDEVLEAWEVFAVRRSM